MSVAAELGYNFQSEKCYKPVPVVDRQTGELIQRPCGVCLPCLRRKQSEWIVRLREQLSNSFSAYFITLTYDDEWVPYDPSIDRDVLDKRDFINFWRRLRSLVDKGGFIWHDPQRFLPDRPIDVLRSHFKYYMTTEYGPLHGRPHGHAIVFDLDPDYWKVQLLIEKCWPYGFISVYSYNQSDFIRFIGYTTKYLVNNMLCPDDSLPRPFSLMSKRLGWDYIERMEDWHRGSTERRYVPNDGGKDILPRYFRDRIYKPSERKLQDDKIRRELDDQAFRLAKYFEEHPGAQEKLQRERLKFQADQKYIELQHMLKKQKIK